MTWVAFVLALTCADGSCDAEDWTPVPAPVDAIAEDECALGAPGCEDFTDAFIEYLHVLEYDCAKGDPLACSELDGALNAADWFEMAR